MADLQPGFRFYPTEEELVSFYLHNKLEGRRVQDITRVIPVVDIYEYNPWELPQFAGIYCRKDPEQWFFFIPMQEREAHGGRPNRLTTEGYWKATGSPGYVYSSSNRIIGGKRTMVFYKGRAPNGRKTRWKMNEYKFIEGLEASSSYSSSISSTLPPKFRQELSICRVYIKSKSLRAFDRRPPAQQPPSSSSSSSRRRNEAFSSNPNHPSVTERTNSQGSSSSGDGAYNSTQYSHAVENGNYLHLIDNSQPMWDWEHLYIANGGV